jgi:hypothetical protein
MRLDRVQGGRSVGGGDDPIAFALEVRPDEPDDLGVVVDDEDRPVGERRRLHDEHHRRRYAPAMSRA